MGNVEIAQVSKGGKTRARIPRVACGAFLGALFVGTVRLAPLFLLAALGCGILAVLREPRRGWARVLSAGEVLASMLIGIACLWPFTLGRYRPADEAGYLSLDLRAHAILSDVPLHDVWVLNLPDGGNGGGLHDMDEALRSYGGFGGSDRVAILAILGAYFVVSRVLNWDDPACALPETSVKRLLTDAEREARSGQGPFLYHLEGEAMVEIQTCAGHAVYVYAMERSGDGWDFYWAAYALRVGRHTPYYMALIDPIRKLIVFPSLLERFERAWRERWG